MTDFKFSELASLYLNNLDVVNAARKAYEADCDKLVESLEKVIAKLIAPETFNATTERRYRYWSLGKGPHENAYLYLVRRDLDYINQDRISLLACTTRNDQATLDALTELVNIDALGLTGREEPTKYSAFAVEIKLAGDDFINETARKVAAILQAMHEAVASVTSIESAPS